MMIAVAALIHGKRSVPPPVLGFAGGAGAAGV
jgi:hypothetical protein